MLPVVTEIIYVRELIVHFAENSAEFYSTRIFYRHLVIGDSDAIRVVQPLFAEFEQVAVLPTDCGSDSLMTLIQIKAGGNDTPTQNARLGFHNRRMEEGRGGKEG